MGKLLWYPVSIACKTLESIEDLNFKLDIQTLKVQLWYKKKELNQFWSILPILSWEPYKNLENKVFQKSITPMARESNLLCFSLD